MKNKGFTLVEMMAVIVLIGLLAVIGIGTYIGMNENAKKKTLEAKISEIRTAAEKWAKENNITNKTTLSVNALVVEGYISADKVDTNGLSEIKNPVTGENMICNTVDISYNNGDVQTIFNDEDKNCKLASQAVVDTNINIKVIDSANVDRSGASSASVASWTNKDVILVTDSDVYDPENGDKLVSISYDFDGDTITKKVNGLSKYTGSDYINEEEVKKYYNVFSVSSEDSLLINSKVIVTYNIVDENSKSRAYTVRIDKEEAFAMLETKSEWVSVETPVIIKVDDGNGSGPSKFYVTKTPVLVNEQEYEYDGKGHSLTLEMGKYYIWTEDKAGNRSNKYKIILDVNNVDDTMPHCSVNFDGTLGDHGWYISPVTPFTKNIEPAGISGINLGINMNRDVPIYTGYARYEAIVRANGIYRNQETKKEGEMYYCHSKTLAGRYNKNKELLFLDLTPPVLTIRVDDATVHTKTKDVHVSIQDALSGLNESSSFRYGFSMSKTVAPTKWTTFSIGAPSQTNETVNKDFTTEEKLTGTYYMWIDYSNFKDYAGNYPNNYGGHDHFSIYGPFKFDNTPPKCNGNNGKTNWTKGTYEIRQNCIDNVGTEDQSLCVQDVYKIDYGNTRTVKDDKVTISDKAGNTTVCDYHVYLDNTAPKCDGVGGKTNWTKGTYTVNQNCEEDNVNQSGCGQRTYSRFYDQTITTKTSTVDIFDAVGNKTTCPVNVYLDNTAPTCGVADGVNTIWRNTKVDIAIHCIEDANNQSGCKQESFPYSYTSTIKQSYEKIVDNVGNERLCGPFNIYLDTTPPVCNGNNGKTSWTKGTYTINQKCRDDYGTNLQSGCTQTSYSIPYSNSRTVKSDNYTIKDIAGNTTVCHYNVYLDNTAPSCNGNNSKTNWTKGSYTINQKCSEDSNTQSGCRLTVFSRDYTATTKNSSVDIFDAVGNKTTCPNNVYLDNTPPSCNGATGTSTTWSNKTRTIGVKCNEDKVNQSGCKQDSFSYSYSSNTTTASEKIVDNVGNETTCGPFNIYVDFIAPTCDGNNGKTNWTKGSYKIDQKCADNGANQSQCVKKTYSTNYSSTTKGSSVVIADVAGNSTTCNYNVYLDNTAPVCGTNNGKTNWTRGTYKVDQNCTEDNVNQSGCGQTSYSYTYTNTTKSSSIDIFDKVGNKTTCSNNVYLDNTAPNCNGATGTSTTWKNSARTIGVKCSEDSVNQSGCKQTSFSYTYSSNTTTASEKIVDNVGNETTCGPFNIYVDVIAPTCGTNNGKTNWSKGSYQIDQNCLDSGANQSQCVKSVYSTNYTSTTKGSSVVIADVAGNKTTCDYNVYLDNTAPTCDGVGGKTNWTKGTYTVSQKCSEDSNTQSGCSQATFTAPYSTTTKTSTVQISDKVGNTSNCSVNVYLDNTAPTCGTVSGDSTNWTNSNRTVTVKCVEDTNGQSGCEKTSFSKTANQDTTTASIEIKDKVGNTASCGPYNFYVDKTPPTCSITSTSNNCSTSGVQSTMKCNDGLSGLYSCGGGRSGATLHGSTVGDFQLNNANSSKKTTTTFTTQDVAGNSGSCTLYVTTITQYRRRYCSAAARCESAGCELYRYDCTGNCGPQVDCNCSSCHTGQNTCKYGCDSCWSDCLTGSSHACTGGYGYIDYVIYEKGKFSGSQACYNAGGVVANDGRCMGTKWGCKGYGNTCKGGYYNCNCSSCKTGSNTCQYGCDKCYQCCRHVNHGCELWYQNLAVCGCGSWGGWDGYQIQAKDCSGQPANNCQIDTRSIYTSGKICGDGELNVIG